MPCDIEKYDSLLRLIAKRLKFELECEQALGMPQLSRDQMACRALTKVLECTSKLSLGGFTQAELEDPTHVASFAWRCADYVFAD